MSERHRIVYSCPICHYMVTIVTAQSDPPPLCCIKHGEKCEGCGGSGIGIYEPPDHPQQCPTCSGTGKAPISTRWTEMEIYSHIDLITEERVV